MKSKKLIVLLIAGAMLASGLTACSTAQTSTTEAPSTSEVVSTTAQTTTAVPVEAESTTEATTTTTTSTTKQVESTTKITTTKSKVKIENGDKKPTSKATTKPSTTKPAPQPISIVLQKNRGASCKSPNVSIATGEVVIDKPGDYVITQSTKVWHGQIVVKLKNTEKASLRFENVNISNNTKNIIQLLDTSIKSNRSFLEAEASADAPELDNALQTVADNDKAPNVSLSFPTGTASTFETSANGFTGVIYNESKLTIKGNGSATVKSTRNANNCICSTKSITIKNLGLTLETAQNTNPESLAKSSGSAKGIFSYSKVTVDNASLTVKSNGDAIRCDRFLVNGGTANLKSSACDAVDTDDSIVINGGTVNAIALKKYSFKVRRVNNTENGAAKGIVRAGKADCFRINAGKVRGESKKVTSLESKYQSDKIGSKQPNLTAKIIKQNAGTDDAANESKVPAIISIGNWKTTNKCTKFLYSSSSVVKGKQYTAKANGNSAKIKCVGNAGVALIKNSTNQ